MYNIRIEKTAAPKQKPGADDPLKFGTIFTNHMFVRLHRRTGLGRPQNCPLSASGAGSVLHGIPLWPGDVRGLKSCEERARTEEPCYSALTRTQEKRRTATCAPVCMPEIPKELFLQALNDLVKLDADWIPTKREPLCTFARLCLPQTRSLESIRRTPTSF